MTSRMRLFASVVLALLPVTSAAAARVPSGLQIVDYEREQRLVVTLGPVDTWELWSASSTISAIGTGPAVRSAIMHQFAIELVDDGGQPVRERFGWDADLFIGATMQPTARFNQRTQQLVLPKPLGYRVDAGDSIRLVITLRETVTTVLYARVTISYDRTDAPAFHMPALPVYATPLPHSIADTAATRSWEWQAASDAQLSAAISVALQAARTVVLHDVTAGALVVRQRLPGQEPTVAFVRASPVVRLEVMLRAGHTYRLTAYYKDAASAAQEDDVLCALLRPLAGMSVASIRQ